MAINPAASNCRNAKLFTFLLMPYLASAPLGTATVGFFVCHTRCTSHTHTIAFRDLVAMAASAAHDKESMTDGVALLRLAGAAALQFLQPLFGPIVHHAVFLIVAACSPRHWASKVITSVHIFTPRLSQ